MPDGILGDGQLCRADGIYEPPDRYHSRLCAVVVVSGGGHSRTLLPDAGAGRLRNSGDGVGVQAGLPAPRSDLLPVLLSVIRGALRLSALTDVLPVWKSKLVQ